MEWSEMAYSFHTAIGDKSVSKEASISYNEADILKGAAEMGDYLGLHRKTIYHMIEQGTLKVTRKGRRLYITKGDLLEQFRVALGQDKGG